MSDPYADCRITLRSDDAGTWRWALVDAEGRTLAFFFPVEKDYDLAMKFIHQNRLDLQR